MTRLAKLTAMYDAVKEGTADDVSHIYLFWECFPTETPPVSDVARLATRAANGDMNAALAFHNAVLPGWIYNIAREYCHVFPPHDNGDQEAITHCAATPALALFLADMAALIELEKMK
jgi:hypothetical protein